MVASDLRGLPADVSCSTLASTEYAPEALRENSLASLDVAVPLSSTFPEASFNEYFTGTLTLTPEELRTENTTLATSSEIKTDWLYLAMPDKKYGA